MANTLTKTIAYTYVPESIGHPADPGHPATPAYCTSGQWVTVATLSPPMMTFVGVPKVNTGIQLPPGSQTIYGPFGIVGFLVPVPGTQTTTYTTTFVPGQVCYPAQPYVPPTPAVASVLSQVLIDTQLGWSGGARAIRNLPASGRVQFKAPVTNLGVVSGLNDIDAGPGYTEMEHAWYVSHGIAKVLESGGQVFNYGAFSAGDLFAVDRVSGVVTYKVNGAVVYTSSVPSVGPAIFDASLYLGGDYIYDPAIFDYEVSNASLIPLAGVCADSAYAFVVVSMLPLSSASGEIPRTAVSMLPLLGLASDHSYGESIVSMAPMTGFASSGLLAPDYGIVLSVMLPLLGVGVEFMPVDVIVISTSMEPLETVAAEFGNEWSAAKMKPLLTTGYERTKVDAEMPSWAFMLHQTDPEAIRLVLVNSSMSVAVVMTSTVAADALLASLATVTADTSASLDVSALINTLIQAGFNVPVLSSDNQVWVISEGGQTSRYEGYPFNSFGMFHGRYYGAREDGIYLLEGDDDAGSAIRASINLGKLNFGTPLKKTVPNCYIGVSSTNRMYLKVTDGGNEYVYLARGDSAELQMQRIDIGKGIRANYLTFEIFNNDGCDFNLDSVEFLAIPSTTRRI